MRSKPVGSLTVIVVLLGSMLTAGRALAADPQPIEGTWEFSGGAVRVEATGEGTFTGVVTKATTFGSCTHPVGQNMWDIEGSGTHYEGTHVGFYAEDCSDYPNWTATWDVTETDDSFSVSFYSVAPDGSSPATFTLQRLKPPKSRFNWTLSMNATSDQGPASPDYIATTASGAGDFDGVWQDDKDWFSARKLDGPGVDALFIRLKDIYVSDDQATKLRIMGGEGEVKEGGFSTLNFRVKVIRSQWRRCPNGDIGLFTIGTGPHATEDDIVSFDICGRSRSYDQSAEDEDSVEVSITKQ